MTFLESMGVVDKTEEEEQDSLSSLVVKPSVAVQPTQTERTDFLSGMGVVEKKEEQDSLRIPSVKPFAAIQPIQTERADFLSEMGV